MSTGGINFTNPSIRGQYVLKRHTFPLITSSYNKETSKTTGSQQLVNMYLEEVPNYSMDTAMVAIGTPGTSLWLDLSGNCVRGAIVYDNVAYVVVDSTLYQVNPDKSHSSVGTLDTSSGRVTIVAILGQLEIADGYHTYNYNIGSNTFAQVTTGSLPANVTQIAAMDGYFIFLTPNSQQVWISDNNDGTSITATHFFNSNSSYDLVVNAQVCNGLLYFFNQYTTSIWSDTGQITIAFSPVQGGVHNIGCAAQYTPMTILDSVYFLAQDARGILGIAMLSGMNMTVLQNRAFAERVNNFDNYTDAYSWTDTINGHTIYNITFPTAHTYRGETWSYDTTTQVFFQRTTYNLSAAFYPDYDRHIANCSFQLGGITIVGDFQSGKLFHLDPNTYTDNGNPIERIIVSPNFVLNNSFFRIYKLDVDLEKGIGLATGQGSDPIINLQFSRDKGNTWSNLLARHATPMGDYRSRVRWCALGGGRAFTVKLTMSDPVKWIIASSSLEMEIESNQPIPGGF